MLNSVLHRCCCCTLAAGALGPAAPAAISHQHPLVLRTVLGLDTTTAEEVDRRLAEFASYPPPSRLEKARAAIGR